VTLAALCLAAVAFALPANAQQPPRFIIGPYLQALSPERVTIRFELSHPAAAVVELSGPSGPPRRFESPSNTILHAVPLTGLSPATTWTYQVRAAGAATDRGSFSTPPDSPHPFSFIVYGDSRSNADAHAAAARAIHAVPSDLLIGTGDIVETGGDRDGWLEFFTTERTLLRDRCLYPVLGNHELIRGSAAPRQTWLRYLAPHGDEQGPSWYSFRWSNTRFFMLDAMDPFDGEQASWLREQLARTAGEPGVQHRFVVTHHGPFSSGRHGPHKNFVRQNMVELLVSQGVSLVFSGHDHIYERGDHQGLKYVISGGAGAPLYKIQREQPGSHKALSLHHFVEVRVNGPDVMLLTHATGQGLVESCWFGPGQPWNCSDPPPFAWAAAAPSSDPPLLPVAESTGPSGSPPEVPRAARPSPRCACELPGAPRAPAAGLLLGLALLGAAAGRRAGRHQPACPRRPHPIRSFGHAARLLLRTSRRRPRPLGLRDLPR
jgi:3',5'-cyclic AMP phosphodiesterase CpdA